MYVCMQPMYVCMYVCMYVQYVCMYVYISAVAYQHESKHKIQASKKKTVKNDILKTCTNITSGIGTYVFTAT